MQHRFQLSFRIGYWWFVVVALAACDQVGQVRGPQVEVSDDLYLDEEQRPRLMRHLYALDAQEVHLQAEEDHEAADYLYLEIRDSDKLGRLHGPALTEAAHRIADVLSHTLYGYFAYDYLAVQVWQDGQDTILHLPIAGTDADNAYDDAYDEDDYEYETFEYDTNAYGAYLDEDPEDQPYEPDSTYRP
ncbi:MAG: hypothetical protein OHK0039_39030 [Bacteroidia bacterium]